MAITSRCLLLAILTPTVAHASFNAAPCSTFDCHFQVTGILLGVLGGLPVSALIFAVLHLGFAHPGRAKIKQRSCGSTV